MLCDHKSEIKHCICQHYYVWIWEEAYLIFFCLNSSFMFDLLGKLNMNFSTKDQVLEVLDKCNTLLVGGKGFFEHILWLFIWNLKVFNKWIIFSSWATAHLPSPNPTLTQLVSSWLLLGLRRGGAQLLRCWHWSEQSYNNGKLCKN